MSLYFKLILFLVAIIFKHSQSNKVLASSFNNDASVAVLDCSKKYPNVYFDLSKKEWVVHGADSKCFSGEKDLLDLCKLVYPDLNIINIMKSEDPVKFTIYGCTNNDLQPADNIITLEDNEKIKNCSKLRTKNVAPYKCLYGDFQSSELYIPPKCQFQHLYSNDQCQSQDHWNLLSIEKCKSSNLVLNTSMLLKWCDASISGVSTFSGIEFVCCPDKVNDEQSKQQLANQQIINYFEDEDIDDDNTNYDDDDAAEDEDDNINDDMIDNQIDENSIVKDASVSNQDKQINADQSEDINQMDIDRVVKGFSLNNEEKSDMQAVDGTQEQKKQYEKQKQLIISSIQASMNTIAKEKEAERVNLISSSKKISQKDSESLFNRYEIRFNRLRAEKQRLLLQEETAYEQQVQGMLNEIKLNTVRDLNQIIQEQDLITKQNLEAVTKSLYNFLMAQENDRLHMITVYKKLKAYFPDQLQERSKSIINHLESIDRALNQTVTIFVKKFKSNGVLIVNALNDHLKRYDNIRTDSKTIINELVDLIKNSNKVETTKLPNKFIKTDLSEDNNYEYEIERKDLNDNKSEENDDDNSDETDESDESTEQIEPKLDDLNSNSIDIHQIKTNSSFPFYIIGICLGILSSLVLICTLIKRRRSNSRQSIKHGFIPIETSNPEDKHVNNMQINGYENPTYKFYETNLKV